MNQGERSGPSWREWGELQDRAQDLGHRLTAERALADELFHDLELAVPFVTNVEVATVIRSGLARYQEARR